MKAIKFLVLAAFFLLFTINSVNALIVAGGEWNDGSQSIEINDGDNIDFNAYFGSTKSLMTINVKLYDSSFNLIKTFEDSKTVNNTSFSKNYVIDETMYQNPGNFIVEIFGTDSDGSNTYTLNLKVNPVSPPVPPVNHAPQITSTPIEEVNEGESYTYDVEATDSDNDSLIYSLLEKPTWLSIDSSTGLITGTAPEVSSDTNFNVKVKVSDGEDYDTQTYTLKVKDICQPQPPVDNPPVIYLYGDNPVTSEVFSVYVDAGSYAIDDVDGDITSKIVVFHPVNYDVVGTYIITYNVEDSAGNKAIEKTRTVYIVDTIAPVITLLGDNPQEITKGDSYTELGATATDNYDGDITSSIIIDSSAVDTSVVGSYTVTYSVTDSSGNSVMATRTVEVKSKSSPSSGKSNEMIGHRTVPVDELAEEEYFEQYEPKTIYLQAEDEEEDELSWFEKMVNAIINFFKRIFYSQ